MHELDQFLKDFYDKYAPGTFTPEKAAKIRQTYGTDYDGLISDLYAKYASSSQPDSAKLAKIKELYGFTAPAQQIEQPQDTGFMAAMQDMVAAAQDKTPVEQETNPLSNAIQRGGNLAEQANIINVDGSTPSEEGLGRVAELQAQTQQLPASEAYTKFNSSKTFGEALSTLASNPVQVIGELTAESLSSLVQYGGPKVLERGAQFGAAGAAYGSVVPGLGTAAGLTSGIGTGALTGMAEGSLGLEYTGAFLESLQEAGVNTADKESLAKAFADDNIISEARSHALKKGIPIAIFDLISGGIAGKVIAKPAKSILAKVGAGATELGIQSAMGAAGETAGQLVSGEEIQPGAILGEAIGELGTAPVEIGAGVMAQNREQRVAREQDVVKEAEQIVEEEPSDSPEVDQAVDLDYQRLADKLDAIELETATEQEIEEDIKSDIEAFSVANEENELADRTYTPEEAGQIQASAPIDPNEAETLLDDSEATPALDQRINDFNTPVPDKTKGKKPKTFWDSLDEQPIEKLKQKLEEETIDLESSEEGSQEAFDHFAKSNALKKAIERREPPKSKSVPGVEERILKEDKSALYYIYSHLIGVNNVAGSSDVYTKKELLERVLANKDKWSKLKNLQTYREFFEKSSIEREVSSEQERQDRIIKYTKQLENIKKDKPGKQMKRLEILNENTLDLPEVNEKVREAQEKLKVIGDEKEFEKQIKKATPEEKLDIIGLRASTFDKSSIGTFKQFITPAKDQSQAFEEFNTLQDAYNNLQASKDLLSVEKAEIQGIFNKVKKEYDKVLEPVRKAQAQEKATQKKESEDRTKIRDKYLTAVAKAVEQATSGQADFAIKEYQNWRKEQGLSEISDAEIKKKAAAEYYVSRAKKEIAAQAYEEKARERKVQEQKAAAEKKAKNKQADDNLKKDLGFSEDAEFKEMSSALDEILGDNPLTNHFENIQKASLQDLLDQINAFYPDKYFGRSLEPLIKMAMRIGARFYKNGLEIYTGKKKGSAKGIFGFDLKTNRAAMIMDPEYGDGHTSAHELIHFIVYGIVNSIALNRYGIREGSGKSINRLKNIKEDITFRGALEEFMTDVNDIHAGAKEAFLDQLNIIARKYRNSSNPNITVEERNLLIAINSYIASRKGTIKADSFKNISAILDNINKPYEIQFIYGFINADEMLAETFSNPYFMTIMGLLKSNKKVAKVNVHSFFRDIIDSFKKLLKDVSKAIGVPMTTVKNSYLDMLTEYMAYMEHNWLTANPKPIEDTGKPTTPFGDNSGWFFHMLEEGLSFNKMTPELNKYVKSLAHRWWKNDNIKTEADVQTHVDRINSLTKKNKLYSNEVRLIWTKIQRYRKELADAKAIQENAQEFAKDLPEYKSSRTFKRDVDDFSSIDLDNLTITQVRIMEKGILELVMGGIPDNKAYNIVNKDIARKQLEALLPSAGQFARDPGVFFPAKISIKYLGNPATYATILAKYNKANGQKLFNTIYSGMLEARTYSQKESNAFIKELFDIVNRRKLSHSDFVRTQMYGVALSTFTNPSDTAVWTDEVRSNLKHIVENAVNKVRAFGDKTYKGSSLDRVNRELDIAQTLLADFETRIAANFDLSDPTGFLTPGQVELYRKFKDFINKYEKDLARNTEGVWGGEFRQQSNYFPTFALGKAKTGDLGGPDDLIPNAHSNNLWEAMQLDKNYGKITGQQSGFTKEKIQPKGYFYDYDLISVAHKFAPSTLFDLYATRELKSLNLLLNGTQGRPVTSNGRNIYNILSPQAVSGLNFQIKSIVGSTLAVDPEINNVIKGIIKARDSVATAMLATTGQFLVQASSAFPAAIIMSPKGFGKAMSALTGLERGTTNFTNVKQFIEDNGLSIQLRDVLFERFQTIEDVQAEGFRKHINTTRALFERVSSASLRRGDKFAARLVWFSAFFEAGGTLDNPTKEAVLAAERSVGLMQNMSDVSFSAPIFRSNNSATRILIHMLYAFKSFALNSALNTYYSGRYFFSSEEARRVMTANILMALSYHAVSQLVIRPTYSAVAEAFGDEGEEEEEKSYGIGEFLTWNTLWDLLIGNISPALVDSISRLTVNEARKSYAANEGEEFDPFLDSPLYAPKDRTSAIAEVSGVYGDLVNSLAELGNNVARQTFEAMGILEESEEIDQKIMLIQNAKNMSLLLRVVPFRGDLQKLFRNYERKLKAEKKSKSGGGSLDPENIGTEFELPEYNFEFNNDPTEIPE